MSPPAVPPTSIFDTDNLTLASYLVARGHEARVVALGRRCSFTFTHSPELRASVDAYATDTARVSPIKLDRARAALRRQMTAAQDAVRRAASEGVR